MQYSYQSRNLFEDELDVNTENDCRIEDDCNIKSSILVEPDPRPHLNVVFIGHVDAGKSTTCGNILVTVGKVDQRTVEKYEKEAKEKHRESWYYAFIFDIHEEERQKGKTVEVGRASFDLEKTRFTILDAPGHKGYIPNMIGGTAQADVAVLIVSARKGEFETGFEKGGQTREHAMLAKTLGVTQLIVAINKMDDPTCNWNEQSCGYNIDLDVKFVPISGYTGQNLKYHATDSRFSNCKAASWYKYDSPTLFSMLDNIVPPERDDLAALRVPLLEGFRNQSVNAVGKIEAGTLKINETALVMPKGIKVKIIGILINETSVSYAKPGENVTVKLNGILEDQISHGSVLCSLDNPCAVAISFEAQALIVDLLEHRPIMTAGYICGNG